MLRPSNTVDPLIATIPTWVMAPSERRHFFSSLKESLWFRKSKEHRFVSRLLKALHNSFEVDDYITLETLSVQIREFSAVLIAMISVCEDDTKYFTQSAHSLLVSSI